LLYPERKGQQPGQLDMGVVLLNTAGLFVYLVPGIVAFAIDISNNTIYLPGGRRADGSVDDAERLQLAQLDAEMISDIVHSRYGVDNVLNHPDLLVHQYPKPELENEVDGF
jgi:hypothetical protein